jgi:hypothetical protein
MLNVKASDTSAILTVTLSEMVVAPADYFLFVFVHTLTLKEVRLSVAASTDQSFYPRKYNQFSVNPSVLFVNSPAGEYHYSVYQKADATTAIDDARALEFGKLRLNPATAFTYGQYSPPSFYTAYNG